MVVGSLFLLQKSAATFSITTFSITTFSIRTLNTTTRKCDTQHNVMILSVLIEPIMLGVILLNAEGCNANKRFMLSVIMISVVILSVVMLSHLSPLCWLLQLRHAVILLSAVVLNVVAPCQSTLASKILVNFVDNFSHCPAQILKISLRNFWGWFQVVMQLLQGATSKWRMTKCRMIYIPQLKIPTILQRVQCHKTFLSVIDVFS